MLEAAKLVLEHGLMLKHCHALVHPYHTPYMHLQWPLACSHCNTAHLSMSRLHDKGVSYHAHGEKFIDCSTPFYMIASLVSRASSRNLLILICIPPLHP